MEANNKTYFIIIVAAIVVTAFIFFALWLVSYIYARYNNPAAYKFSSLEDKNFFPSDVDNPVNIQYNIKESVADCLKACEADPKCDGFTWFDANAPDLPKRCVGFSGKYTAVIGSNHHVSAVRL